MPEGKLIKLTPAKGRPMLHWVGKRPLERVTAFPAQLVEKFVPASGITQGEGLIFHGDNKDVLAWLLANGYRGKVNLVYIDPPFDSGADYVRKVELRGAKGTIKLDGESHALGEQIQYTDIWTNDGYLQYMYERLLLLKELLADDGSFYLHCDWHKSHHLRCLVDEIFGSENCQNEVIWQRTSARSDSTTYNHIHDTIMFYTKGRDFTWSAQYEEHSQEYVDDKYINADNYGRYQLVDMTSPNPRPNMMYEWLGYKSPAKGWRYSKETMQKLHNAGKIWYPDDKSKRPRFKKYLDEVKGRPMQSIWTDIYPVNSQAIEREGYPTQKPEALLERLLLTSSNPNDLVLDCFAGSGTTAAVAQKLGRRWIIADINKGAIQTASKRLQRIIQEQAQQTEQLELLEDENATSKPAQLAFSIYRVNDYDLQIQHNEALNLAIEHVGIERLKGDPFFDGTLGKRLVKITPFNHPLTRLDLQSIQDEIKKRPSEERDIVVVCLGKELTADAWLAEYNKKHPVNKISVIELRTDPRYGKFFEHRPATTEVKVERAGGIMNIEILDFLSPTILERLEMDTGVFKAKITDWRAMVDTDLIDTDYNGEVFNVTISDVPERKSDLVSGKYQLPVRHEAITVAVKIIDMLGEEVLVVKTI